MTSKAEITATFWKHLRSDRLVMLGRDASAPTALRPMTAQLDGEMDQGPIWFFASTDTVLVQGLNAQDLAIFTFVSKGYDVFATVHGHMRKRPTMPPLTGYGTHRSPLGMRAARMTPNWPFCALILQVRRSGVTALACFQV
jgi:hypothetical protein